MRSPSFASVVGLLTRSLLRTVAVVVAILVLASVVGVVVLIGTNPPSPQAGTYISAVLIVSVGGGLVLSVLVLAETAVDLIGFVGDG